jgi:uncharacterized protein YecT (DUF1311 family)
MILGLSFVVSSTADAQVAGSEPDPCAGESTTSEIRACLSARLARADSVVRVLAAEVREAAAHPERADSTQAAWREYRRLHCRDDAARFAGGSLAPVVALSCQLRLTEERAAALRQLLSPDPDARAR